MKQVIVEHYCDYCGKLIKERPKTIKTVWHLINDLFGAYGYSREIATRIDGDGCEECYRSFLKWKKSRKINLKNLHKQ